MDKTISFVRNLSGIVTCFLFAVVTISLIIYVFVNPEFKIFYYIGGASTLAIALLTVAYVFTTSQQLTVMHNQLVEMKKSRELLDQPLPFIEIKKCTIIRPRFYYTPPSDEYSWNALYNLDFSLRNISNYPAINLCLYAQLSSSDTETHAFKEFAHFYEIVGKKDMEEKILITDDRKGSLLKALTAKQNKSPKLSVRILFKNILGACFACEHHFYLQVGHPKAYDNIDDLRTKHRTIESWYEQIRDFEINFKNEYFHLKKMTPHKSEEWDMEFEEMNHKYGEMILGDDQDIDCLVDSSLYRVKVVSEEEYIDEINLHKFPGWDKLIAKK